MLNYLHKQNLIIDAIIHNLRWKSTHTFDIKIIDLLEWMIESGAYTNINILCPVKEFINSQPIEKIECLLTMLVKLKNENSRICNFEHFNGLNLYNYLKEHDDYDYNHNHIYELIWILCDFDTLDHVPINKNYSHKLKTWFFNKIIYFLSNYVETDYFYWINFQNVYSLLVPTSISI